MTNKDMRASSGRELRNCVPIVSPVTVFGTQLAGALTLATALMLGGCSHSTNVQLDGINGATPELRRSDSDKQPYDSPGQARRHFARKRAPLGHGHVPTRRYIDAWNTARQMPLYSARAGERVTPTQVTAAGASLQWQPVGPGNVGGRTRALVIQPSQPQTMYAAGVAGGVWKSTDGGQSWEPTSDFLANIAVSSLAMSPSDPSTLYAGTGEGFFNADAVRGAGIFKTTDGGGTWTRLSSTDNTDFFYVNDLHISPNDTNRIYAATRTGVFRSTDAGASWQRILDPLDETGTTVAGGCLDLAAPSDTANDVILAACGTFEQSSIYRTGAGSTAAGTGDWSKRLTEPGMGRTALAIAPSDQDIVYALSASVAEGPDVTGDGIGDYNGGLHAVFRSNDEGRTWQARVRNDDAARLNTLLLSNPIIATQSVCSGTTDSFLNQGWYDNIIRVDPLDPERVWAGGIDLFRSDDGGQNWGVASYWWAGSPSSSPPEYAHADHHSIVFHPGFDGNTNTTMYVGSDGGIFRTNNARAAVATGSTATCDFRGTEIAWTDLNNGYGVTQFYHGLPYPSGTRYFGGTQDNGTLRGNDTDGANQWGELQAGDGGYVALDRSNIDVLYAEFTDISIRKSVDGGTSFRSATQGIQDFGLFINPFIMDRQDPQRLWTTGNFIWRTDDGASNWVRASTELDQDATRTTLGTTIAVAPTDPSRVLIGRTDGTIHRQDAAGQASSSTDWPSARPVVGGFVSSLSFDPNDPHIAYATYSNFGVDHVWKSTDGGGSWSAIGGSGANALPDVPVHDLLVDPVDPDRLFVATDVGVFVSTDGGTSWARENTGFANVITEHLALSTQGTNVYLYAFTHGRGAFRVDLYQGLGGLAPHAAADVTGTLLNRPVDIGVLGNDFDPNGDSITITQVSAPGQGSVAVLDGGTTDPSDDRIRYTPDTDFLGTDAFTYTVADGNGGSDMALVEVEVALGPAQCPPGTSTQIHFSDDIESGINEWSHSATTGIDTWVQTSADANSGSSSWHADDIATVSDQRLVSPSISVPAFANELKLAFYNRQSIESDTAVRCFDGGLVEVSSDDGSSWRSPADEALLTDAYDGLIADVGGNPLAGRRAWCGDPQDWLDSVVALDEHRGRDLLIRFRLGTDNVVAKPGWNIDDVRVKSCPADSPAPPSAAPDVALTRLATDVSIDVLANDGDPNQDLVSIVGVTSPAHGTVLVDDAGTSDPVDDTLTYMPDAGFKGTDTFSYEISDGNGGKATAQVSVEVSTVVNGSFEHNAGTGETPLAAWTQAEHPNNQATGAWLAQSGTTSPLNAFNVQPPTAGNFTVMSDQTGSSANALYQDISIPARGGTLKMDIYIRNHASDFSVPDPDTFDPAITPNQQFRVDILDPTAGDFELGAAIERNILATLPGDPLTSGYNTVTASMDEFAGESVRLRFMEVGNQHFFNVGIDNVHLDSGTGDLVFVDSFEAATQTTTARTRAVNAQFAAASGLWKHTRSSATIRLSHIDTGLVLRVGDRALPLHTYGDRAFVAGEQGFTGTPKGVVVELDGDELILRFGGAAKTPMRQVYRRPPE